jgi:hypothetical protein
MIDDGSAVHYTAVERGTPIFSSDEVEVGTVEQILDNYREHIFDGIVMRTAAGEYRFVDAPEVKRTAERAVTLSITAAEAEQLPPPEKGPGEFEVRRGAGKVARRLGFGWKKRR